MNSFLVHKVSSSATADREIMGNSLYLRVRSCELMFCSWLGHGNLVAYSNLDADESCEKVNFSIAHV